MERDEEMEESVSGGLGREVDFDGLRFRGFFPVSNILAFFALFSARGQLGEKILVVFIEPLWRLFTGGMLVVCAAASFFLT